MEVLKIICQVIIGLGILNVWFLRPNKMTAYRGGEASTLKQEFGAYGLPAWMFVVVGVVKVGAALALLAGIAFPQLVRPAAGIMAVLMVGAIVMHIRVNDSPGKSLPAATVLLLSVVLLLT